MSVRILQGDCLTLLPTLAADSLDSCVTDPPYHLTSIVKRFGSAGAAPAQHGTDGAYARASKGFMGKAWDGGDVAFRPETWAEVLRVMKPGAHLAAFGGTRTFHRMVCAIEDAGFEVRDRFRFEQSAETKYGALLAGLNDEQRGALLELLNDQVGLGSELAWTFGSGFPKSHDVSKAIDRAAGAEREIVGRKTGRAATPVQDIRGGSFAGGNGRNGGADCSAITAPATEAARQWQGWGTALKPAYEPIILARKPLSERTVAANVLRHGCGALNIDASRVPTDDDLNGGAYAKNGVARTDDWGAHNGFRRDQGLTFTPPTGRWSANVITDGSPEVLTAFPDAPGQQRDSSDAQRSRADVYGATSDTGKEYRPRGDTGTAARFFYAAKANKADRAGSKHPTVKPLSLMTWLVRLITPPGGTVLDPFAGTGSTGLAADHLGFNAVLIEQDATYAEDARRKISGDAPLFGSVSNE